MRDLTFGQLADKLNRMSESFQTEVKQLTEFHIGEIEMEAIRNAPGGGDQIATQNGSENQRDIARGRNWTPISQAIGYTIDSTGYKGSVFVDNSAGEIAAWVEFGTGQSAARYLVSVPREWRELARTYYVNGRGTILAQPYLLPAFMKHQKLYIKDLKEALKRMRI